MDKSVRCRDKALREIVPQNNAVHVEKDLGNAVGRDFCNISENYEKHDRSENRLNEKPERTENRLLISRGDVSFYKRCDQIPVLPQFFQVKPEKTVFRSDYRRPILFVCTHRISPSRNAL